MKTRSSMAEIAEGASRVGSLLEKGRRIIKKRLPRKEQRAGARFPADLDVHLSFGRLRFPGRAIDISGKGALIQSHTEVWPGVKARMELIIPSDGLDGVDTTIRLSGTVVRARLSDAPEKNIFGLEFDPLKTETRELLERYFESNVPSSGSKRRKA